MILFSFSNEDISRYNIKSEWINKKCFIPSLFVCVGVHVNVCQICAVQPLAFWELHHLLCCKSGARSANQLLLHTKHSFRFCNLPLSSLCLSAPASEMPETNKWEAPRPPKADKRMKDSWRRWMLGTTKRAAAPNARLSFTCGPPDGRTGVWTQVEPRQHQVLCVCADGSHRARLYSCRQTLNLLHLLSWHLQTGPKTHALSVSVCLTVCECTLTLPKEKAWLQLKNNSAKDY